MRQRLGVQDEGDPASDDEGIPFAAHRGRERDASHLEHFQNIRVVVLEGDGEGDDVEVAKRPPRFEA